MGYLVTFLSVSSFVLQSPTLGLVAGLLWVIGRAARG